MTLYQGDDLINLLTVTIRPSNPEDDLPEITEVDIKIGSLCKKYKNPSNPFTVNIRREESIKLSVVNKVFACIMYKGEVDGKPTILKKTCEGTLTIKTKPELVNGRCCC